METVHEKKAKDPDAVGKLPVRRKKKRTPFDESSSSSEEEEDPSSSTSESSDDDGDGDDDVVDESTIWAKRFQCHVCPYGTIYKTTLRQHMSQHADNGHDVDDCNLCADTLSWTPGRGNRDKDPEASSSLGVTKKQTEKEMREQSHIHADVRDGSSPPAKSQPLERYPKWDKRCHLCGQKEHHKNSMLRHMLKHKDERHNIDDCDHSRKNLAWTLPNGRERRGSFNPITVCRTKNKRLRIVDLSTDDSFDGQEEASKEKQIIGHHSSEPEEAASSPQ